MSEYKAVRQRFPTFKGAPLETKWRSALLEGYCEKWDREERLLREGGGGGAGGGVEEANLMQAGWMRYSILGGERR